MSYEIGLLLVAVVTTWLMAKVWIDSNNKSPMCLKCEKKRYLSEKYCSDCGQKLRFPKVIYE